MKSEGTWKETTQILRWLNEKEVSKILGISIHTLRNWRFQRVGPPYAKLGRAVRYRADEALDFAERRKINMEGGD